MFNSDLNFEGWPLKQIVHPIANAFLQKPGQGSHQIGPQYLLSKLHDILTSSLKVEEIIVFQKELIVKEVWKIYCPENWWLFSSVWTSKTNTS